MKPELIIVALSLFVLGLVGLRFLGSPRANAQPLHPNLVSQSEFKELVKRELKLQQPSLLIEDTEPLQFNVYNNDGNEPAAVVFIGSVYATYEANPKQLNGIVSDFVGVVVQGLGENSAITAEINSQHLAVVLRHRDYLTYIDPEETVQQTFRGDLIAMMVAKHPNYLSNVTRAQLEKLGLSDAEAWQQAADNLTNKFDDREVVAENQGAKVISASSGLATGQLWLLCSQPDAQDFDSMVINKDSYMYAEISDETASMTLAKIAANFVAKQNTLSDNMISCFEGQLYASKLSGSQWLPIQE